MGGARSHGSRWSRWRALPAQRRALLLQAGWALLSSACQLRWRPYRKVTASWGPAQAPVVGDTGSAAPSPTDARSRRDLADIAWAVSAWTRRWPWPPTCLMQGMAAQRLLVRRGLACELILGVRLGPTEPDARSDSVGAHAWVRCCGIVVTGAAEAELHRPIAVYRWPAAP